MSRNKGTFNFSSNFEVLSKSPLDAKQLVGLYSDLTGSTTWQDSGNNVWLYDGAIVSVGSDPIELNNGIYRLKLATGYTSYSNWIKVMDSTNPSFSGIISGNGSGLTNIPITGVTNLEPYLHTQNTDTQLKSPDGSKVIVQTDNNNNFVINGNVIQSGSTWETHTNHIYTTGNTITLRDGAMSTLSDGEYVGFIAKKYDGVNDGVLVYNNDGVARVGDMDTVNWTGTTQPLATREEMPLNDGLTTWSQPNNRFETITKESLPISTLTQNALDTKSNTGHTHDYLPLTGGTLSGDLTGTTFYGSGVTVNGSTIYTSTSYNVQFSNTTSGDINILNAYGSYFNGYASATITISVINIGVDFFEIIAEHSMFGSVIIDFYDISPIELGEYFGGNFMYISFPQFLSNIYKGDTWTFTPDASVHSEIFTSNGGDETTLTFGGQYTGMNNLSDYTITIVDTDNYSYIQITVSNFFGIDSYNFYDFDNIRQTPDGLLMTFNPYGNIYIGDQWYVQVNTTYTNSFTNTIGTIDTATFSGMFTGNLPTTNYSIQVNGIIDNQEISIYIIDTTNGIETDGPLITDTGVYSQNMEGLSIQFPNFTNGVYLGDTWTLSPVNNYIISPPITINSGSVITSNIITNNVTTSGLTSNIINSNNIITSGLTATIVTADNLFVIPIEKTYEELLSFKNSYQLVIGQQYTITDYRTTYTQPITNLSMGGVGQTNENPIEQIIITANATNGFEITGKSKLYPQDIIYYDINDNTEGFTKGKIFRRIDVVQNNDIGTDWRHIKYRRYALNVVNTFESISIGTSIPLGTVVSYPVNPGNIQIYICITQHFKSHISPNMDYFGKLQFSTTDYVSYTSSNITITNNILIQSPPPPTITIGVNSEVYADYTLFQTYGSTILNNTIKTYTLMNSVFINSSTNYSNIIGSNFTNNTIGDGFYNNIISNNFFNNYISNTFIKNLISKDFYNNIISNNFSKNTIYGNFYKNLVLSESVGFTENIINGDFYENYTIDYFTKNNLFNFYNCVITYGFVDNNIDSEFNHNIIKPNFSYNKILTLFSYLYVGSNFRYNNAYNRIINLNLKGYVAMVSSGVTSGDTVSVYSTTNFSNSGSLYNSLRNTIHTYTGITSTSINGISPVLSASIGTELQFYDTFSELYYKTYVHHLTKTNGNKLIIQWIDDYGDTNILKA